jgi:ribonuclease VapC
MFLDARAIVSLMSAEPTAPAYELALTETDHACTSILAAWEAIIILSRDDKFGVPFQEVETAVLEWLDSRAIALTESTSPRRTLSFAIEVAQKYGVGKRALSSLDCFHYAYAKTLDQPLLTLDRKLRGTDIATLP